MQRWDIGTTPEGKKVMYKEEHGRFVLYADHCAVEEEIARVKESERRYKESLQAEMKRRCQCEFDGEKCFSACHYHGKVEDERDRLKKQVDNQASVLETCEKQIAALTAEVKGLREKVTDQRLLLDERASLIMRLDEKILSLTPKRDHCQCQECSGGKHHASDCAVHNMPAYPNGKCDCALAGEVTP